MIEEPRDSDDLPPAAVVTIRKNSTGEVFAYNDDWRPDLSLPKYSLHNVFWMWTDGNNSCDCNRHRYWQRSHDVPESAIADHDCGDEERGGNEYTMIGFEAVP